MRPAIVKSATDEVVKGRYIMSGVYCIHSGIASICSRHGLRVTHALHHSFLSLCLFWDRNDKVALIIGPEGDFTPAEVDAIIAAGALSHLTLNLA